MNTEDLEVECCPICMCAMSPYIASDSQSSEEIALLPCRHYYHDLCIQDWTRTATSCPYCRAEFTTVGVVHCLNGPVVRNYNLELKVQEESVIDEEEYSDTQEEPWQDNSAPHNHHNSSDQVYRCVICGSQGQETCLLLCDACNDCYHDFCLGADQPVVAPFYCPTCVATDNVPLRQHSTSQNTRIRTVQSLTSSRRTRRHSPPDRRTPLQSWTAAWARVREQAWSRLNADLEFDIVGDDQLTAEQESDIRHWRQRFERRGPLRDTTESVLPFEAQTEKDLTARLWQSFERASKIVESSGTWKPSASRAGSLPLSPSDSSNPVEQEEEPIQVSPKPKRQKRPNSSIVSDSAQKRIRRDPNLSASPSNKPNLTTDGVRGSFISSLLCDIKNRRQDEQPINFVIESASHAQRPLSPISIRNPSPISPARLAITSAPQTLNKDNSEHSPSTPSGLSKQRSVSSIRPTGPPSPPLETHQQPLVTKTFISRLVHERLKPFYKIEITKEEFITINRTITRRIFEDYEGHSDEDWGEARMRQRVASEVNEELHLQ